MRSCSTGISDSLWCWVSTCRWEACRALRAASASCCDSASAACNRCTSLFAEASADLSSGMSATVLSRRVTFSLASAVNPSNAERSARSVLTSACSAANGASCSRSDATCCRAASRSCLAFEAAVFAAESAAAASPAAPAAADCSAARSDSRLRSMSLADFSAAMSPASLSACALYASSSAARAATRRCWGSAGPAASLAAWCRPAELALTPEARCSAPTAATAPRLLDASCTQVEDKGIIRTKRNGFTDWGCLEAAAGRDTERVPLALTSPTGVCRRRTPWRAWPGLDLVFTPSGSFRIKLCRTLRFRRNAACSGLAALAAAASMPSFAFKPCAPDGRRAATSSFAATAGRHSAKRQTQRLDSHSLASKSDRTLRRHVDCRLSLASHPTHAHCNGLRTQPNQSKAQTLLARS